MEFFCNELLFWALLLLVAGPIAAWFAWAWLEQKLGVRSYGWPARIVFALGTLLGLGLIELQIIVLLFDYVCS